MATPDDLLASALHGTAWRAAVERRSLAAAVAELRGLAGGRDDVIAETAGVTAGSWMAWPEVRVGHELVVAGVLIMAAERLDYDLLGRWVRVGYERGLRARRPVHGDPIGNGLTGSAAAASGWLGGDAPAAGRTALPRNRARSPASTEPASTEGATMLAELRTHSLSSGEDLLVLATDQHIEAPNWTPDGRWLVVNCQGRIYRIPATGGELELVDTAPLDQLNNDHVLSPDGGTLYLSSSSDGHLYAVPASGGRPVRLSNDRGPDFTHYLHGISPDGQTLAYVGVEPYRGVAGAYRNIFTVPSAGGPDRRLTDTPAPADGPEFSPDGEWIYFNSEYRAGGRQAAPGHAQVFRMRPDGSELTQLTDDERVNWFPHLSPDGRHVLFVSFPPGTEGHPADRDVLLRVMGPEGGEVREVVRLRGGQGSANVNGWAPDSDRFAYVAYPEQPR